LNLSKSGSVWFGHYEPLVPDASGVSKEFWMPTNRKFGKFGDCAVVVFD
jgi:hypothetical protein